VISRKVGLHLICDGGLPAIPLGKPALVKLVNPSPEHVRAVRAMVGPDALIVCRWFEAAQPLDNPERRAGEWFTRLVAQMRACQASGGNIAFEGYNEIADSNAALYARFECERLGLMHAANLRACVGNWSVGVPDIPVWATYAPVLAAMRDDDVLGLHEYWSSQADTANLWHVARWTMAPIAALLGHIKIVITECGRDIVEGKGAAGWQRTCNADGYMADLRLVGQVYDSYERCIGATVYQAGSLDSQWRPFDVASVWPRVVAEYGAPVDPPVLPPHEEPPTIELPGYYQSLRQGHAIEWVVLHDTEGPAQASLAWWQSPANEGRSSAHYLVCSDGRVISVVPESMAAHHAGYATLPGFAGNPNLVSIGIELEYPKAPESPAWPEVQLAAAAALVREVCERHGIDRSHVVLHRTIDPTRRSDPRNWDEAAFLDRVFGAPEREPLPEDETGSPAVLAEKARWWAEEQRRTQERANAIGESLITLLSRLESTLKEHA
jgi:hypothetical protein